MKLYNDDDENLQNEAIEKILSCFASSPDSILASCNFPFTFFLYAHKNHTQEGHEKNYLFLALKNS